MSSPGRAHSIAAVAIDGPAASGKTVVGRMAADALGWRFLDTGIMYRAVTRSALRRGISLADQDALAELTAGMTMRLCPSRGGEERLWADGEDVTDELRTDDVERSVSAVSSVPGVRKALVAQQRAIARDGPIVMAGRDIGAVVLTDAPVKIFLTASAEERARRRHLQTAGGSLDSVLKELARRDGIDSQRRDSPMRPAEDAVIIDTDGVEVEEIARRVAALARSA